MTRKGSGVRIPHGPPREVQRASWSSTISTRAWPLIRLSRRTLSAYLHGRAVDNWIIPRSEQGRLHQWRSSDARGARGHGDDAILPGLLDGMGHALDHDPLVWVVARAPALVSTSFAGHSADPCEMPNLAPTTA